MSQSSLSSSKPRRYLVPTHLNVPDTIAVPLVGITLQLTIRQGLMFLCGWSFAFHLWRELVFLDTYGVLGNVCRWSLPLVMAVATVLVALIKISNRFVEEWAVVLLQYLLQPKVSIWQKTDDGVSLREEDVLS